MSRLDSLTLSLHPHSIAGHLSREEGRWLRTMASGRIVLEIGGFRGRSTAYLGSSALCVYTCDHFRGQKSIQPGQRLVDMAAVERDWRGNVDAFGLRSKVHLLRMDSRDGYEFLRTTGVGTFDLIFVDGGHDYETVRADTRFAELLSPDGTIAFHDYHSAKFPGIKAAVDEWRAVHLAWLTRVPTVGSISAFRLTERVAPSGKPRWR